MIYKRQALSLDADMNALDPSSKETRAFAPGTPKMTRRELPYKPFKKLANFSRPPFWKTTQNTF